MPASFTSGPTAANLQTNAFDTQQTPNQDGTVYGIVVADGAAAPTNLDVKNARLTTIGTTGSVSHTSGTNYKGFNRDASSDKVGQTFLTPASDIQIDDVGLEIIEAGDISGKGNLYVEIWNVAAGVPSSIVDNGLSSPVSADDISSTPVTHTFTFTNKPELPASGTYAIVLRADWAYDNTNFPRVRRAGTQTSYSDGLGQSYNSSTLLWSNLPGDLNFTVNYHEVTYTSPLEDATVSATEDDQNTLNFSGLTADTQYDVYIVLDGDLDGVMVTPVKLDVFLVSIIGGDLVCTNTPVVTFTGKNINANDLTISVPANVTFTGTRKADQTLDITVSPVLTFTGVVLSGGPEPGVRTVGFPITLVGEVKGGNLAITTKPQVSFTGQRARDLNITTTPVVVFTAKKITTGGLLISEVAAVNIGGNIITDLTLPAFWPSTDILTFVDAIFLDKLGQNPVAGTELRYTLDGTTPDINSPIYTGGIVPDANQMKVTAAYIKSTNELVSGTLVSRTYNVKPAPINKSFFSTEFFNDLYGGVINFAAGSYKVAFYTGAINFSKDTSVYTPEGEVSPSQCAAYNLGGFSVTPVLIHEEGGTSTISFGTLSLPTPDVDVGYSFRYLVLYDTSNFDEIVCVLKLKETIIVDQARPELIHFNDLITIKRAA